MNEFLSQRNQIKSRYESNVVVLEEDAENEREVAWGWRKTQKGSQGEIGKHVGL